MLTEDFKIFQNMIKTFNTTEIFLDTPHLCFL
jgi:hypothetical protein